MGASACTARDARPLDAYGGLGAWVSVYDHWSWRHPGQVVRLLAQHRVHTLYLETSSYRRPRDIESAAGVSAFIEAAHSRGIEVVAWYVPSLTAPARDLRRSLAAVRFTTSSGQRFDSFALDVESTLVRSIALRNTRAVQLAAQVRRAVPEGYPLGAIVIAPVGASPTYWPRFPFRGLARSVDILLPMAYFTYRTRGAAGVRAYTAANLRFVRAQAGRPAFPVHVIGGITPRASSAEVRAFVAAATDCGAVGASLWQFERTTGAEWAELAAVTRPSARPATSAC